MGLTLDRSGAHNLRALSLEGFRRVDTPSRKVPEILKPGEDLKDYGRPNDI